MYKVPSFPTRSSVHSRSGRPAGDHMGCTSSQTTYTSSSKEGRGHGPNQLEVKLTKALLKRKQDDKLANVKTIRFEKILLKFDGKRQVIGYVRSAFDQVASNGWLDFEGLEAAMKRLRVDISKDEMLDLFCFVDV